MRRLRGPRRCGGRRRRRHRPRAVRACRSWASRAPTPSPPRPRRRRRAAAAPRAATRSPPPRAARDDGDSAARRRARPWRQPPRYRARGVPRRAPFPACPKPARCRRHHPLLPPRPPRAALSCRRGRSAVARGRPRLRFPRTLRHGRREHTAVQQLVVDAPLAAAVDDARGGGERRGGRVVILVVVFNHPPTLGPGRRGGLPSSSSSSSEASREETWPCSRRGPPLREGPRSVARRRRRHRHRPARGVGSGGAGIVDGTSVAAGASRSASSRAARALRRPRALRPAVSSSSPRDSARVPSRSSSSSSGVGS